MSEASRYEKGCVREPYNTEGYCLGVVSGNTEEYPGRGFVGYNLEEDKTENE